MTIAEEERVQGTSETSGLLWGQLGQKQEMGGEEVRTIGGTFTPSEAGQEVRFKVLGREPDADEYR